LLKIYQKYIASKFINKFLITSTIFFTLAIILGVLEEINFFKDLKKNFLLPYLLTVLNAPTTLFEILPFIFLLSVMLFFNEIFEKKELSFLKKSGISNLEIIKVLSVCSIIIGLLAIFLFYNIASNLKYQYSNIKNNYSSDNRYLAMVNENGLWIKDELNNNVVITRAKKIQKNSILDVLINEFDSNFNLIRTISADKINISSTNWVIYNPTIIKDNISKNYTQTLIMKSNFDEKKINSLFSDISTMDLMKLYLSKKEYEKLGYSSKEIKLQITKLLSLPITYLLLTIFSAMIMLNFKKKLPQIFYIIIGVLLSVIIYYINFIFFSLGINGKLTPQIAIFFPLVILGIFSLIGLISINDK